MKRKRFEFWISERNLQYVKEQAQACGMSRSRMVEEFLTQLRRASEKRPPQRAMDQRLVISH